MDILELWFIKTVSLINFVKNIAWDLSGGCIMVYDNESLQAK